MIDRTKLPKPQQCTAVVVDKKQVSKTYYLVTFQLQTPQSITYLAGQTMMLKVAPGINRVMSIASAPSDPTHILMCQDTAPMGPASKWTLGCKAGDMMQMVAPMGMFVMDKESHRKKILIATGSGIAPYHGMLLDYFQNGGTDDATLYWGMRYEEDLFWQKEFEELSAKYPQFRFVLTLSKPSDGWQGKKGRVTDHIIQEEQNPAGSDFYLCGSQVMVKDVEAQLATKNVPLHQIFKELYF